MRTYRVHWEIDIEAETPTRERTGRVLVRSQGLLLSIQRDMRF